MIRMSTRLRDEEIARLYKDGVRVKLIVKILNLPSKWIVYKSLLRAKREFHCECCPNHRR